MNLTRTLTAICLIWFSPLSGAAELGGLMDQAQKLGGDSVASMLGSQLGISGDQAAGGLGGLFELARNQLSAGDFDTIAESIPGIDGYIEQAEALGLLESPIENVEALKAGLGRIGLDSATVDQFLPAAIDALGKLGGADVSQLLKPLLG